MPRLAPGDALLLSPPGLGPLTIREARHLGLHAVAVARDRRADMLAVSRRTADVSQLRTIDDALVVAGSLRVHRTAAATARGLDELTLPARRGLRVVVRVTDERHFRRTELRAAIEGRLGRLHDRRHDADELWVLQTDPTTLQVAVRARGSRGRAGRVIERPGALPPTIAAAMVVGAGRPQRVLDPCCGSGTIASEAAAAGGVAVGGDIDERALAVASMNTRAALVRLDARRLPFPNDSFDAIVSNLPFGHLHQVQGTPVAWYRRALGEALRVADTVVVLAAPTTPFRQALGRTNAALVERYDVRVLGRPATIWSLQRR